MEDILYRGFQLNSWDQVTGHIILLATLNNLIEKRPVAVILATALILIVLYWIVKQVTIGLLLRFQELRHDQHRFI